MTNHKAHEDYTKIKSKKKYGRYRIGSQPKAKQHLNRNVLYTLVVSCVILLGGSRGHTRRQSGGGAQRAHNRYGGLFNTVCDPTHLI